MAKAHPPVSKLKDKHIKKTISRGIYCKKERLRTSAGRNTCSEIRLVDLETSFESETSMAMMKFSSEESNTSLIPVCNKVEIYMS